MPIQTIAVKATRGGHDFQTVAAGELEKWAQAHGLNRREAILAALEAGIFPECYERNFPSLSVGEQLRLFQSAVLVAGAGGLGGFLIELLARVGVGRLLVADGDIFAPANLNRQLLATAATLGRNKAEVAAAHLREINPGITAEAIPSFLHRDNLWLHLPGVQVVADGLDTLQARRQVMDAAWEGSVPLVHGAVVGKYGQVTSLLPGDEAGYQRLSRVLAHEPEATREILAPVVALVASLQVQEIIRLLLGQPPAYQGVLAHFDGDTGRLEILPLS